VTQAKKEIAVALLVAVFVGLSLFSRWMPLPAQDTLFLIVLLFPPALAMAGWWRLRRIKQDENTGRRRTIGLLGLLANTLAIVLPFAAFFYNFALIRYGRHQQALAGFHLIDLGLATHICLVLSTLGAIAGILAPSRIRLAVALGGFTTCCIILSIPMGVL
jgi:hypothetical protein